MKKVKLNIGCGGVVVPGYINIDSALSASQMGRIYKERGEKMPEDATYIQASITDIPMDDNSAEYIELVDMIEHVPMRSLTQAFKELYRVLAPGGSVCIATTNFDDVARFWLEKSSEFDKILMSGVDISSYFDSMHLIVEGKEWDEIRKKPLNLAMAIVYGNQFHEGEYHKSAFTPTIMHVYLRQAGFEHDNIEVVSHLRNSVVPELDAFNAPKAEGEELSRSTLITEVIVAKAKK